MTFLTGTRLGEAIHEKLREDDLRLAIAFWETGAPERLIGKRARVICNLASGGTNPRAISSLLDGGVLQSDGLRQFDSLHAKVYCGRLRTIVTSANLSANGLGLEGVAQAHWEEAGVEVDSTPDIVGWFDDLWARSRGVTQADLDRAADRYQFRQRVKPAVPTFDRFNLEQDRLPLLRRAASADWSQNDDALVAVFGTINEVVSRRLNDGVELVNKSDLALLQKRWVLTWSSNGRRISESPFENGIAGFSAA